MGDGTIDTAGVTGRRRFLGATAAAAAATTLLAARPSSAAPGANSWSTFVFDPTEAPSSNRFADWPSLMAAVADAPYGSKAIHIQPGIADPYLVPPGTWNLHGATFVGRGSPSPTGFSYLLFGDNTQLEDPGTLFLSQGIVLRSVSHTPIITITDDRMVELFGDASIFSDHAPFFEVATPPGRLVVFAIETGPGFGNPTLHPEFNTTSFSPSVRNAGSDAVVVGLQKSVLEMADGTLASSGSGGFVLLKLAPTAGVVVGNSPDDPATKTGSIHPGAAYLVELNYNRGFNIALNPIPALGPGTISAEDAILALVAQSTITEVVGFTATTAKKPIAFTKVDLARSVIQVWNSDGAPCDARTSPYGWKMTKPDQITLTTPSAWKGSGHRIVAIGPRRP